MLSTPKLAALAQLADRQRWRVVLVGDPLQLSAVGRGGMFAHLLDQGPHVELERVRRFEEEWERQASFTLRRGDPHALAAYQRHDRLHHGDAVAMEHEVVERWLRHRADGESVCVVTATNDSAHRLNHAVQQRRMARGELDPHRSVRGRHGQPLHVGDEVATRRNDRTLTTTHGDHVRNRARWTVTAIHPDGGVTVAGRHGQVSLPNAYVENAVELAYAETAHGAQGRTVDHSLLYTDSAIDARTLYVGMTRGRRSNHAYTATDHNNGALDMLAEALQRRRADHPAIGVDGEAPRRMSLPF